MAIPMARPQCRFGDRRIEDAAGAEGCLQSLRALNTPPLPFTSEMSFLAARVGDVLAEHDHTGIAAHFLIEA